MLKNTILFSLILLSFIAAQTLISSYTNGAPSGYTGSPGDGKTCAASTCHTGSVSVVNGWVTSTVPEGGYVADSIYSISVTATEVNKTKFGFELSPQDLLGNQLGTLITSSQTQLRGAGKYMTHKSTSVFGLGSKTWSFEWMAPSVGAGDVTFYVAFNCSNSNGNVSGDNIYRGKLTVQENTSVSIEEYREPGFITVYPNPSTGIVKLKRKVPFERETKLRVYNPYGELVFQTESEQFSSEQELDLSALQNGLYIIRVHENRKGNQVAKVSIFK